MIEEKDEIEKKEETPGGQLSPEQIKRWVSRSRTANDWLRKELMPKYVTAKRRYHSECDYKASGSGNQAKASHGDVNLLFKVVRDFIGSIFFKNPEIDLTARDQRNPESITKIENLEQKVNDDIKDNAELKGIFRSALVDESLAGVGAIYSDFRYEDEDALDEQGNPIQIEGVFNDDGTPAIKRANPKNSVEYFKIRPENLILPPWIQQYNYKTGPYIGYIDIVSLEKLKADENMNQEVVAKIKGAEYKSLVDREYKRDSDTDNKDDILHAKIYYLFIRDEKTKKYSRLVVCDEGEAQTQALYYGEWDKGHKNSPLHVLMLNDSADGFLPPSEAWILESILLILDYVFNKMDRHVRKSGNKTLVSMGKDAFSKPNLDKLIKNFDKEIIGIPSVPGQDIRSLVYEIQSASLSGDHQTIYELARAAFDNISRQPSFSKASVVGKEKTATEAQEIAADDSTENGDYIDKFRDFLKDLFMDHARMIQKNFQGMTSLKIVDRETGEEEFRDDLTIDDFSGEFGVDIQVSSFQPPNKNQQMAKVSQTMAQLGMMKPFLDEQGMQVNGARFLRWWTQAVDVRDGEDLIVPKPKVRSVDQQLNDLAYSGVPMNVEEISGNPQEALARAMALFGDDRVMQNLEAVSPGVSQQGGPFVNFIKQLEMYSQPPEAA